MEAFLNEILKITIPFFLELESLYVSISLGNADTSEVLA